MREYQGRDPFLYAQASYFPKWKNYMDKLEAMKKPTLPRKRTTADFVDHFFTKYGDCHDYLPLWMAVGVADFGFISFFYQHSPKIIQSQIAVVPAPDSSVFHSRSTGTLLYICKYLLSYIAPQSQWKARAERLFAEFAPLGIGIEHMGLSVHWQAHPLWK
ncbi:MAG: Abi family protein [Akkermansia sp.]